MCQECGCNSGAKVGNHPHDHSHEHHKDDHGPASALLTLPIAARQSLRFPTRRGADED